MFSATVGLLPLSELVVHRADQCIQGPIFKTERHYLNERDGGFLSWLRASRPGPLTLGGSSRVCRRGRPLPLRTLFSSAPVWCREARLSDEDSSRCAAVCVPWRRLDEEEAVVAQHVPQRCLEPAWPGLLVCSPRPGLSPVLPHFRIRALNRTQFVPLHVTRRRPGRLGPAVFQ